MLLIILNNFLNLSVLFWSSIKWGQVYPTYTVIVEIKWENIRERVQSIRGSHHSYVRFLHTPSFSPVRRVRRNCRTVCNSLKDNSGCKVAVENVNESFQGTGLGLQNTREQIKFIPCFLCMPQFCALTWYNLLSFQASTGELCF